MSKSTTDQKNVIYGLYCVCDNCKDRREWIRYVGQTIHTAKYRLRTHLNEAFNPNIPGKNYPKNKWIRKHGAENIRVTELEVVTGGEGLNPREKHWIRVYDTDNLETGGLNLTPGGDSSPHRLRGENVHSARLTSSEVAEIKRALWSGTMPIQVSRDFGATPNMVHNIDKDRKWVHVPWPIGPRERTRNAEHRSRAAQKRLLTQRHPMTGMSNPPTDEVKKALSEKSLESWRGGDRKARTTLTPEQRVEVKEAVMSGTPRDEVAARYDVSMNTVHRIVRGTIVGDVINHK